MSELSNKAQSHTYFLAIGNDTPVGLTQSELDMFLDAALPFEQPVQELVDFYRGNLTDKPGDDTITIYSANEADPIIYRGENMNDEELAVYVLKALEKVLRAALKDA